MHTSQRKLGKTYVTQSMPWGLYLRNGHRLLCADGIIRAASMAQTADTFFSIPASIRVNGKTVTGYCTTAQNYQGQTVYTFRHHNNQQDKFPHVWPSSIDRAAHDALIQSAL